MVNPVNGSVDEKLSDLTTKTISSSANSIISIPVKVSVPSLPSAVLLSVSVNVVPSVEVTVKSAFLPL